MKTWQYLNVNTVFIRQLVIVFHLHSDGLVWIERGDFDVGAVRHEKVAVKIDGPHACWCSNAHHWFEGGRLFDGSTNIRQKPLSIQIRLFKIIDNPRYTLDPDTSTLTTNVLGNKCTCGPVRLSAAPPVRWLPSRCKHCWTQINPRCRRSWHSLGPSYCKTESAERGLSSPCQCPKAFGRPGFSVFRALRRSATTNGRSKAFRRIQPPSKLPNQPV